MMPNHQTSSATAESGQAGLRRFARHLALPGFSAAVQQRLADASVLCIGAGGLGCPALLHLAAAGVGHVVIVDDDRVSLSNLQRQILFTEADVGRWKAEAAAERLQALHSALRVTVVRDRFRADNADALAAGCAAILDGSDNFETRYLTSDLACRSGLPDVYGAVHRYEGQVSVFHPAAGGPCYRCMFPVPPAPGTVPTCAEAGVLGVVTGWVGTLQAAEVIKLLTGLGRPLTGRMLHADLLTMEMRTLRLRRDPDCPACGPRAGTAPLPMPAAACRLTTAPAPPSVKPVEWAAATAGNAVVLDVRAAWEVVLAPHPATTLAIPFEALAERLDEVPRDRPVLVVCGRGERSLAAAALLVDAGFPDVRHLAGGLDALD